jgi:hypothetical protein
MYKSVLEERAVHRLLALLFAFSVGILGLGHSLAQPGQPATHVALVQRDVQAVIRSLYRGEIDTVLRYTHPTILQQLGGPEQARRVLADAITKLSRSGMKIEAFSFPQPPQFFEGGGRRFVFVPTLSIISNKDARVESLNFQLGILDPGTKEWKYVEGSRLTTENVQIFFPGFPKDRPFPRLYRKKL